MAKKKRTQKKTTPKKVEKAESLMKTYSSESVYITHLIRDYKTSKKFYNELLELKVNLEIPEAGWYEYQLPVKGAFLGLSQYREGEFHSANSLNISVNDIDKTKASLDDKEIPSTEIIDLPGMISMITIHDPDGNKIYFIGPPRIKAEKE